MITVMDEGYVIYRRDGREGKRSGDPVNARDNGYHSPDWV